jgi:hypothetical protein
VLTVRGSVVLRLLGSAGGGCGEGRVVGVVAVGQRLAEGFDDLVPEAEPDV